jgi:hypothetical protein
VPDRRTHAPPGTFASGGSIVACSFAILHAVAVERPVGRVWRGGEEERGGGKEGEGGRELGLEIGEQREGSRIIGVGERRKRGWDGAEHAEEGCMHREAGEG